ncbi:Uncharacterised protein [Mycobacteroides abscessus subsp. abscessus]|nr:Uncharacterised protein [Mycobacteroides abscessus]SHY10460.1 Uncharacterised protein [Mycobacteroides abscessus subsp. abscessus]
MFGGSSSPRTIRATMKTASVAAAAMGKNSSALRWPKRRVDVLKMSHDVDSALKEATPKPLTLKLLLVH